MTLPSLREYPSTLEGHPELTSIELPRRRRCAKCKSAQTRVAYQRASDGKAWPTCLDCALTANRHPCTVCGYVGPSSSGHDNLRQRPVTHHHDTGQRCYPIHADDEHVVACSSCGGKLELRVIALEARILGGVTTELRCTCGAAWALTSTKPGINVYLGRSAA